MRVFCRRNVIFVWQLKLKETVSIKDRMQIMNSNETNAIGQLNLF